MFYATLEEIIAIIAQWIGYIGMSIVIFGAIGSFLKFLFFLPKGHTEKEYARIRHYLMLYLTIALDFLIAKDIILTLAVEREGYEGLIQLLLIVCIRVVLSYFIHMEETFLHKFNSKRTPIKK